MTTFKNAEYTITTSLSEQESSIYIKVANNISYATYEGTFERSAFRVSFEIAGIHRLINKCFAGGDAKYSVRMEMEPLCLQNAVGVSPDNHPIPTLVPLSGIVPNALRLRFDCNIEELLVVEFEIRLKEKMVANDAILSVELEKQKQLVEMLTDRVEKQTIEYRQVLDQQRQLIERLSKRLDQEERKTADIVSSLTTEIAIQKQNVDKLTANIHNNYVLFGYKLSDKYCGRVLPIFVSPEETTSIFNTSYRDCIIVSHLRYLRNFTKIDIMSVVNTTFIFDNIELIELVHKTGDVSRRSESNNLLNIDVTVRENNPKYFVVFGGVFTYVNGRVQVTDYQHEVQTYVKNGLKKLYEKLLDINIELTMPSELLDFILK